MLSNLLIKTSQFYWSIFALNKVHVGSSSTYSKRVFQSYVRCFFPKVWQGFHWSLVMSFFVREMFVYNAILNLFGSIVVDASKMIRQTGETRDRQAHVRPRFQAFLFSSTMSLSTSFDRILQCYMGWFDRKPCNLEARLHGQFTGPPEGLPKHDTIAAIKQCYLRTQQKGENICFYISKIFHMTYSWRSWDRIFDLFFHNNYKVKLNRNKETQSKAL